MLTLRSGISRIAAPRPTSAFAVSASIAGATATTECPWFTMAEINGPRKWASDGAKEPRTMTRFTSLAQRSCRVSREGAGLIDVRDDHRAGTDHDIVTNRDA